MTWKTLAAVVLGIGLAGAAGCDTKKPAPQPKAGEDKDEHEHGPGPHSGTIIELSGGKIHGEFTVDHDKKEATVYLLGGDAKTPHPMKVKDDKLSLSIANATPPFQVDLLAQDKTPDGKASKFVGKHEGFGKEQEFSGVVTFEADGKPYAGDLKEEPAKKK